MRGGAGDETYLVDHGQDQVFEIAGEGFDEVRVSTSYALTYGQSIELLKTTNSLGTDYIELIGNDFSNTIRGNAGVNYIRGGPGNDKLFGLGGDDVLIGDQGRDRLIGGPGDDTFVFTDTDLVSRDAILDFVSGSDNIDLGWFVTDMGGVENFHFLGGGSFSHNAGEARFSNGLFQLDLNGDAIADLSIAITGSLTAADFSFGAIGYWDY
jgi:Ca2+-binding RTX toxin-like protein